MEQVAIVVLSVLAIFFGLVLLLKTFEIVFLVLALAASLYFLVRLLNARRAKSSSRNENRRDSR